MAVDPVITTAQRRARLGQRHLLAPGRSAPDSVSGVVEVADALVALHATDPATVVPRRARAPGGRRRRRRSSARSTTSARWCGCWHAAHDVRRAGRRSPRSCRPRARATLAPCSAGARGSTSRRAGVIQDGGDAGSPTSKRRTLRALVSRAARRRRSSWSQDVPALRTKIVVRRGQAVRRRTGRAEPRCCSCSRPRAAIVRGRPLGGVDEHAVSLVAGVGVAAGRLSRARAGRRGAPSSRGAGCRVRSGHGRRPEVVDGLDDGAHPRARSPRWAPWRSISTAVAGLVLPDDVEPVAEPEPWVALLPGARPDADGLAGARLVPRRSTRAALFDRSGNIGPTVWCDGRIVGGWAQRADGEVALRAARGRRRRGDRRRRRGGRAPRGSGRRRPGHAAVPHAAGARARQLLTAFPLVSARPGIRPPAPPSPRE